jgi:hypothetical protein
MQSKKLFLGGINNDDSYQLIDTKEYLNALNFRFVTSENGKALRLENVEGNVIKNTTLNSSNQPVTFTLPAGANTTIGAIEDTPNKRVFFFNKNSNGSHGIYCYDADNGIVYTVMLNSQVDGGLGFSEDIHSSAVIDKLLYWTDGVNQQRRINIEAAINYNHPGTFAGVSPYQAYAATNNKISQSVISLIRNQPWSPLTVVKNYDSTYVNNFVKNEAFQFAYRFVYRDYEVSTFSPLSDLVNFSFNDSYYITNTLNNPNRVVVTVPLSQKIDQDVIRVEIAVKFAFGGNYSVVKSFDSGFTQHNSGTALAFNFYNDKVGIAVDGVSATKPYDSVPLRSETLEIGRNRLFLGNNTDGYESPKSTSISVEPIEEGGATITGSWELIEYNTQYGGIGDSYIIYIGNIGAQSGFYYNGTVTAPPLPTTIDFTLYQFLGSDIQAVAASNILPIVSIISEVLVGVNATVTNAPAAASIIGDVAYKSDSTYRFGVVFFDEAGRKCGVVTNDNATQIIPDRTNGTVAYVTNIRWILSNLDNSEIPDWARYYSVVSTKNLRTSSFLQLKSDDIKYATKDPVTGVINPSGATSYAATNYGVAIKVSSLFSFGLGYAYGADSGDIIKLYPPTGSKRSLRIKDQVGEWVIADLADIGTLTSTINTWVYEIYTPYSESVNEPYYERAQTYQITSPGTPNRAYSVVSGQFGGDITILSRGTSTYLVEAMSPNDSYWSRWNVNTGRPNIVLNSKQVVKKTTIYWSNPIILGTEINGLSTFDALDQEQLPYEMTSIQKLQLVNKAESEGTIMLAIGEQETAAVYLGETQVFDNTGSSFLAKSSGVVGNINVLRGSFGTINPESVIRYMGQVFWFDAIKGCVVSYSTNGLFPISNNKMFKYFKKVGQDVLSLGLKFFGGFDPYHNEVLMFAPRKSALPSGARLLDMQLGTTSYNFTTVAAPSTIVVNGDVSYTYSGGELGPNTATVTGSTGPVTFTYVGTSGTVYGPSTTRPNKVGTYSVTATVASDGVYDAATSAPFAFAIATAFQFEADYMLLTYQFTDGIDLDTRTRIVTPDVGQDSQNKYIGWAVQGVWPTTGTPILDWGGDNTGTGFESVLLNLVAFKAAYPSATTMVVDMRAFWYNTVGVQPVNVEATLWKGGTPIEQGSGGVPAYSFTNPTATDTLIISSVGKQITSDGSPSKAASSGERVATLTYNVLTGVGSFNSNDTTTPSV